MHPDLWMRGRRLIHRPPPGASRGHILRVNSTGARGSRYLRCSGAKPVGKSGVDRCGLDSEVLDSSCFHRGGGERANESTPVPSGSMPRRGSGVDLRKVHGQAKGQGHDAHPTNRIVLYIRGNTATHVLRT